MACHSISWTEKFGCVHVRMLYEFPIDSLSSAINTDENLKGVPPRIDVFVPSLWHCASVTLMPTATQELLCSLIADH